MKVLNILISAALGKRFCNLQRNYMILLDSLWRWSLNNNWASSIITKCFWHDVWVTLISFITITENDFFFFPQKWILDLFNSAWIKIHFPLSLPLACFYSKPLLRILAKGWISCITQNISAVFHYLKGRLKDR